MEAVSIVIPTVNEEGNIRKLIPRIEEVLKANRISGQIIVVDDQSEDGTPDAARKLAGEYGNIEVIIRERRDGLGNALKRGVDESSYDYVVFMDADLSHDPEEIPKFMEALREYDVVVGSRYLSKSRMSRSYVRKVISGAYNMVSKTILGIRVSEITSGYRAFKRDVFKSLKMSSNGPEIHAELVVKASIGGCGVGEIPISYMDRSHGETKLNYLKIGPGYTRVMLSGFISKLFKFLG
jgi:dolichol-phosphate mannosyltransferase